MTDAKKLIEKHESVLRRFAEKSIDRTLGRIILYEINSGDDGLRTQMISLIEKAKEVPGVYPDAVDALKAALDNGVKKD